MSVYVIRSINPNPIQNDRIDEWPLMTTVINIHKDSYVLLLK